MFSQSFYSTSLASIGPELPSSGFQSLKYCATEKQMVADLLRLLLGIPSQHLVRKAHSDQYQMPENIQMSHLSAQTLKSAVMEITKMGNHLHYIQKQLYRLYQSTKNPIVKTFCSAVFDFLTSFKKHFSDLLAQLNEKGDAVCKKITLLSLSDIISQKSFMLQFVIRCLNVCSIQQQNKPQVVRLLNKLWEIEQELMPYEQQTVEEFLKIFKCTLRILFKNIQDWFRMRTIPESMDFFIIQPSRKSKLPQNFLHSSDQVDAIKLPFMFESQSQGILQVGKTIRFISLYYQDHEQQKLVQSFEIQKEFQILDEAIRITEFHTFKSLKVERPSMNDRIKKKNKKKKQFSCVLPEDNPFQMFTEVNNYFKMGQITKRRVKEVDGQSKKDSGEIIHHGFGFKIKCLLTQILENINKKCLKFFKEQEDLGLASEKRIKKSVMHALMGIKKFMLLEKGDFLQQFFNAAESILDKQKGLISHNKIYSCIDEAINNSSVKTLPQEVLSNVYFDFKKIQQKNTDNMRLWFIFCFWFKQDGPITYIFTSSLMEKLRGISNFIFRLKKGQYMLTKIWDEDRDRKVKKNRGVIMSRAIAFRNALHAFFYSCLAHIFTNIEIIWGEYNEKIEGSATVFQIVSESVQMVEELETLITNNQYISIATINALNLLQKFQKFCLYLDDPTMIIHVTEVDRMDYQLKEIAQIAMKIPELQEIINYNNFYNRLD